jgi:PAS domain S-box-containing protein
MADLTRGSPLPQGDVDHDQVFRTLFAHYPDALIVANNAGVIVLANPPAEAMLGYGAGELVGLSVEALVPNSVRPRHAALRASFEHDPRPRPMGIQTDLVARRKDGSETRVEIALSPMRDQGQSLVVAAIRDISSYPRVLQALQRARYSERLAQLGRFAVDVRDAQPLIDEVPVAVVEALDADNAVVYLLESNRLELRVASAVGALPGEGAGDRVANRADTSLGIVLAHGGSIIVADYATETRFVVPDAYRAAGWTSALAVAISDFGKTVGVLVVRSRQARHFGADELRFVESLANLLASALQRAQSEEALNHAQRLESVGQLTGGIAHDFNNLLTVIQGNLQVLEELPALAGDEFGRQLVDAAARASRRGAELTSKLLAFSRRQVLQPTAVDVAALVHSLADMLRRTLDQRVRIVVEVAADCPTALADPVQLEAALLNIAINARDAMPEGGVLRFVADAVDELPAAVALELDDARAPGPGFVAIAIADSGTGMSDDVRERAFEPFFTTKTAGRGTGLGLSTVHGFAKQSKGAVRLESSPGSGTTVVLYIPRLSEAPAGANDEPGRADRLPRGLRVLLVEDDLEVSAVVRRFFEGFGSVVTTAPNGEQALIVLGKASRFDLLVSDIALGSGVRGTELAAQVQQHLPDIKVLLMSGYSAELLDADRHSPPPWELLRKPFSREELAQAAARVLGV